MTNARVFHLFERACCELAPNYILASDAPSTFEGIVAAFEEHGKPVIWDGASDRTIFRSASGNYAFRSRHDYTHIINRLDFTTGGECETFRQQAIELRRWVHQNYHRFAIAPKEYAEALVQVLRAEIIGQLAYKLTWGEFPANQRAFVEQFLINEGNAIDNRDHLQ